MTHGPYKSESSAPEYIAAYADSGQLGFVAKSDLSAATTTGTKLKIVSDTSICTCPDRRLGVPTTSD